MLVTSNKDRNVRKLAAEIRESWTAGERRRRMGLPPDMPANIRDYLTAPKAISWSTNGRS